MEIIEELNIEDVMKKRWLSLREAKLYANVKSDKTIREWLNAGQIKGCRRTGSWVVDRESIDQWFSADQSSCESCKCR